MAKTAVKELNIGGDPNDPTYRYKMPGLQAKVEGRGNGIKTRIVNMKEVSRALCRDPAYTTKFFGCELCAQSKYDEVDGSGMVNGSFEVTRLQELLDKFIKHFVLCRKCGLPETVIHVKGDDIYMDCGACGTKTDVDARHKLCTFIIKNPPKGSKVKSTTKPKDSTKTVKKVKKIGKESESSEDEADVEWFTDTSKEAMEARRVQMVGESAALQDMVSVLAINEKKPEIKPVEPKPAEPKPVEQPKPIEKPVEVKSEKPAEVKPAAAPAKAKAKAVIKEEVEEESDEDEELTFEVFVRRFKRLLSENKADKNSDIVPLLQQFDQKYSIDVTVDIQLLVSSVIDLDKDLNKEISKRGPLFRKFCKGNSAAQFAVLVGFERLMEADPDLMSKTTVIFQTLYDQDIVEEEAFSAWAPAAKKSTRAVRKETAVAVREAAAKFITWLKEAEEEEA